MIYVVLGPDGLLVKRLHLREEDDGRRYVVIVSDNAKKYAPFRVPAERFEQDYRVVAFALEINRKL